MNKPATTDTDFALVVDCCCYSGTRKLTEAQYRVAWGLADGFGCCDYQYASAHGFYGDWSHFRDSTDAAIAAVATYLRSL